MTTRALRPVSVRPAVVTTQLLRAIQRNSQPPTLVAPCPLPLPLALGAQPLALSPQPRVEGF